MREAGGAAGWSSSRGNLLPELSDDLAIECIARVPRFLYPKLALVSRSWRAVFNSSDLFASRISGCSSEKFLCIDVRTDSEASKWFLLDFHSENPNSLVPLPPPPIQASGSACAAIGHLLFVLGGSVDGIASSAVQIFDARFGRWDLGPRMRASREFAAAGAVNGRIYVIGGCLPSSEHWAEFLDVPGSRWSSFGCPIGRREKWMHGSVVLDGKLLAVADRGGVVFDPSSGFWGLVSTALDIGWKGRAAAVDGIIYSYDFLGKIKGFDPVQDCWRELEGVDKLLPKFLAGATLTDFGGFLCVVWQGKMKMKTRRNGLQVLCAGIKVEKTEAGRLIGEVVWRESLYLGVPPDSALSHCLTVEI